MKTSEKLKGVIDNKWLEKLTPILDSIYMDQLFTELKNKKKLVKIFPDQEDIFNAFKTPFDDVKVVILGQDPYHTFGHAHGYAFSSKAKTCPPSLRNILQEVEDDVYGGLNLQRKIGDFTLTSWANQGVLLLNTALTVEQGIPGSHLHLWTKFTIEVMKILNSDTTAVIFMLWGKKAQFYKTYINEDYHYILEAAHPSPFSASDGFFGCKHFSEANKIIKGVNGPEFMIKW